MLSKGTVRTQEDFELKRMWHKKADSLEASKLTLHKKVGCVLINLGLLNS